MKKTALFSLLVCCFYLAGCTKDAEINAFITEFDATTNEIVQKVDANPGAAGVDEAQKVFEAKKAALTAKWDAIKNTDSIQMSDDARKKLKDSAEKNMTALNDVQKKHMMELTADKDAAIKFQALLKEFVAIFTPPNSKNTAR